jgi:hypothetical protein
MPEDAKDGDIDDEPGPGRPVEPAGPCEVWRHTYGAIRA